MRLLARVLLVQGAQGGVFAGPRHLKLVRVATGVLVAFLVLAPVAAVLSAIPYGGGGVQKEVRSLLAVTQAIGMYLLYRGLVRGAAWQPVDALVSSAWAIGSSARGHVMRQAAPGGDRRRRPHGLGFQPMPLRATAASAGETASRSGSSASKVSRHSVLRYISSSTWL